jgi:multidrug efflux system membrane fusion protein
MKIKGSQLVALAILGAIGGWMLAGDLIIGGQANPDAQTIVEREAERSEDAFRVRYMTVSPAERQEILAVRGRTIANNSISVRAETGGRVEDVRVAKGQEVAAGDLLCVIDDGVRGTSIAQAEAALEQAQADFGANDQLLQRGFVTRSRMRQLQTALDSAKANLAAAKQDMTRTEIRTTIAGTVTEPLADVGDHLSPSSICATVVQLDPVKFTGQVSEQKIGEVSLGMPSIVQLVDERRVTGKIAFISPVADERTRTFGIEVLLPNPDRSIREGITATAAVPLQATQAFRLVPSWLTLADDGEIGVRVVGEGDAVAFKPIKIVAQEDAIVWATGLEDGDRVITLGQNYVSSGQTVIPVPDEDAAAQTAQLAD